MAAPIESDLSRGVRLSRALKAVRRERGLRPAEAARAMGLPLRTYEHFEAGKGRFNVERVHQFAQALDVDPYAILAAVDIGSPAFAARCIDNKLMTVFLMALQEFDAKGQDDLNRVDARSLITGFTRLFDSLLARARDEEAFVEDWMVDKTLLGPRTPPDEDA
jgi:transcriptional regulator with XRE-family HTH domain